MGAFDFTEFKAFKNIDRSLNRITNSFERIEKLLKENNNEN